MTLEAVVSGVGKSINIETKIHPYEHLFIDFDKIVSYITLSNPIKAFEYEYKKLRLRTENASYCIKPYWEIILSDESEGILEYSLYLRSGVFNQLSRPFENYSEKRLKKWQEAAFKQHHLYIRKLEELYWQGKEITNNFFNLT